jgi:hypothetical protein
LMLSIFFWQSISCQPLSSFSISFQSGVAELLWGTHLSTWCMHAWYEHVNFMMNSPFEGWHMVITLVWWNKNRDSCPNSTMKIFWVTVIGSPTSLEFKMLQKGFVLMQINKKNSTYNLKTGSIHYVNMGRFSTWSQKGLISAQWRSS